MWGSWLVHIVAELYDPKGHNSIEFLYEKNILENKLKLFFIYQKHKSLNIK